MAQKTDKRPLRVFVPRLSGRHLRQIRLSWFLMGGVCGIAFATIGHYLQSPPPIPPLAPVETALIDPPKPEEKQEIQAILEETLPASLSLRVTSGDTLLNMLTDTGISYDEAYDAVQAIRTIYDPKRLDIGQQVAVDLDKNPANPSLPSLTSLSLPVSKTAVVQLTKKNDGVFHAQKIEAPVVRKAVALGGTINSSFYETGIAAGIPADLLTALIKAYSYDVDFQRDIKKGHKLNVVIERLETDTGIVAGYGNLLYASLNLGPKELKLFRYTDKNGNSDYYNEKGESLRKALLRTPINGARITSRFGPRMHPLLGYTKMHRGVDFGAATGTPIYAAGDGIVEMAGVYRGYGNYVRLKHDGKYSTAYGHASKIASGIRKGVKVRQGQVIAYVGSTGMSTGPHLHYEVLANGKQVNPAGLKFKTGNVLAGAELKKFKAQVADVQTAMRAGSPSSVASTEATVTEKKN